MAGIDNAGKSSILHILKKNYSFLNKLKPTKGIERISSKILGIDLVFWDMGGQEQYIQQYFDRKEYIFNELSLLFFIIDIQDAERFDKVLSYFERIVSVFHELDQSPNIIILFHKVDPDIEYSSEIKLYIEDLKKSILKIASEFKIAFFNTSIFKRWSIVDAFSYSIRSLFEENVAKISDYLKNWADFFGATSLLLMSADDIVISEFSTESESASILDQYVDELRKIYSSSQKPVEIKTNGDFLTLNPLNIKDYLLYLIKYTNNPNVSEEQFTQSIPIENINELEDILSNFFQKA
jgi:GTPase SAR1 family protein